jgi:hypothetical protein
VVAALSAAFLLVVGLLSARHEAEVAHVRDQKGDFVHGQALAEHHESGPTADMHSRAAHRHAAGACALLASLHAPAVGSRPPATTPLLAAVHEIAAPPVIAVHGGIAAYRLAPKTSPPALI